MLDTASHQHQPQPQQEHSTLREHIEMDDSGMTRNSSRQRLLDVGDETNASRGLPSVAKHTLGLILLLCVVFLWTLSNFLGSVRIITFPYFVQDETDKRCDRAYLPITPTRSPFS